jgi:hypothetical protein
MQLIYLHALDGRLILKPYFFSFIYFVCVMHLQLALPISLYRWLYNDNKVYLILSKHKFINHPSLSSVYIVYRHQLPLVTMCTIEPLPL